MRIAVLSGARKNAGDYLITRRCELLLLEHFKDSNIIEYPINDPLDGCISEINEADLVVVPGGPIMEDEYPVQVPLTKELSLIGKPMAGIGLGWYGSNIMFKDVYDYVYTKSTKAYLNKISVNSSISCRDWFTVRTMKNNGIQNPVMTGCPAWYDLSCIESSKIRPSIDFQMKRIAISDPAKRVNRQFVISLVEYLHKKYPDSEIHYVYHRGIPKDEIKEKIRDNSAIGLNKKLISLGVTIEDISSSSNMDIYDKCDLHIGFRVHAHIYCLSHRGLSILLEEDGRGAGVNDALSLGGVPVFSLTNNNINRMVNVINKTDIIDYLIRAIDDLLFRIEQRDYIDFENAYKTMQKTYDVMDGYIESIKNFVINM